MYTPLVVIEIAGRSPHGERGLKYSFIQRQCAELKSLSSRRAWIEILRYATAQVQKMRRSPHGERGLKCTTGSGASVASLSLSSRRAWIEIGPTMTQNTSSARRSPHGERGLKYELHHEQVRPAGSRFPHGERGLKWDELGRQRLALVALLTESVD